MSEGFFKGVVVGSGLVLLAVWLVRKLGNDPSELERRYRNAMR